MINKLTIAIKVCSRSGQLFGCETPANRDAMAKVMKKSKFVIFDEGPEAHIAS